MSNITQCLHLLHLGDRNRTTAFTALNAHSSRSHAVRGRGCCFAVLCCAAPHLVALWRAGMGCEKSMSS